MSVISLFVVAFLLGAAAIQVKQEMVVSAQENTAVSASISPLLQYQGRLSDPDSGQPVADGSYTMTFRLYSAPSGGSALWVETKDVPVKDGLFSTLLGDNTPLAQDLFTGQALWLGIKVGADEEATPRQQIVPVAYALSLVPGASIHAENSTAALNLTNTGSGAALHASGPVRVDGDLNLEGSLIGGTHKHANYVDQYSFADHIYGGMHPIASGVIMGDGSILAATNNVSSSWNSGWQRYEIIIDGHTYDWPSYVTQVTPVAGGIAHAWSSDGKLCVGIYGGDGQSIQLPFQFVVFKP